MKISKISDIFELENIGYISLIYIVPTLVNLECVLNKAGVTKELLDTIKARKLAYYGHAMRKQGSCLEKEIMQGTMPGAHRRGRPRTAWMDNIKTWTGLSELGITHACRGADRCKCTVAELVTNYY